MNTIKAGLNYLMKIIMGAEIVLISLIVVIMLFELILRNLFNESFRSSTELCSFLFMWMAFLGVIILYDQDRLISLDMLYLRVDEKMQTVFWFANKLVSIGLGIVMVIAYQSMYAINRTSYFSTMQWLSKAWHFLPMALVGGFIVVKTIIQISDKIILLKGGK